MDDDGPDSPSPTLIEEYAKDPEVADLNWEDVSVLHTHHLDQPSALRPPCEEFNKGACVVSSTCPRPHVCSSCHAEHPVTSCSTKARGPRQPERKERGTWNKDDSYSPCAEASLNAAPLPRPPPLCELPPALVRVVRNHPELFDIQTPINVDVFEGFLATHPNPEFVSSVVIGLREGFWPFASPPRELPDESRRQKHLVGPKREFLDKHVQEEIRSRRFSHPFKRLLAGMACMPVHVASAHGKFRLIYDHSAGQHALNSLIPKHERSAPADGLDALIRVLRNRHLHLADVLLFKSDVSHAFRILPMSPYWQAMQAVKINGLYYVDRCNTFGNAGSQRLFCAFYSLVLWIAENLLRLTDICCYVDDNFSWEYRGSMKYYRRHGREYPTKQARLLGLWDCLGIPHATKKQEFGNILTILGYHVDLKRMRVTVSDERLEHIFRSLSEYCAASSMTLHECQKLAGLVNWALEVNPLLRPGITPLHEGMAKVDATIGTAQVAITAKIIFGMRWLEKLLRKSKGVHITGFPYRNQEDVSQIAYICASTEGFGLWLPITRQAFYHRFINPEPSQYISHAHTFAVLCALYVATREWRKNSSGSMGRLALFTNDKSTFSMFSQLRAPDELRHILLIAMEFLVKADMDFVVLRTGDKDEFAIADRLSHDSMEDLTTDFPDLIIREFDIPPRLAHRAQWVTEPSQRCLASRTDSVQPDRQSSSALKTRTAKEHPSNALDVVAAKPSPFSIRGLLASLTNGFR